MRTTLAVDDDVLLGAKTIARQQRRSIGEVVSGLARLALRRPEPAATRGRVPMLPGHGGLPSEAKNVYNIGPC